MCVLPSLFRVYTGMRDVERPVGPGIKQSISEWRNSVVRRTARNGSSLIPLSMKPVWAVSKDPL